MNLLTHVKKTAVSGSRSFRFDADTRAQANIGIVGPCAQGFFSGYEEEAVVRVVATINALTKSSPFPLVLEQLGKEEEICLGLAHVVTMAAAQSEGQPGDLLLGGRPNLFCVLKKSGLVLVTLRFCTGRNPKGHWDLGAYDPTAKSKWHKGDQIITRAL